MYDDTNMSSGQSMNCFYVVIKHTYQGNVYLFCLRDFCFTATVGVELELYNEMLVISINNQLASGANTQCRSSQSTGSGSS